MIAFKLNNKKVNIPSTWFDPTFGQYIKILEHKGKFTLTDKIALFSGIDSETLNKSTINGLELVVESLSFMNEKPQFAKYCTQIGSYELPLNSKGEFNIQFESLPQFEDMRSVIMKVPNNDLVEHTRAYASYISIYLQKLRDKSYKFDEAIKMREDVFNMPAHQVIPLGSFFFVKLLNSLTGIRRSSQNTPQSQKKNKPVSAASKKRSVRSRRLRR